MNIISDAALLCNTTTSSTSRGYRYHSITHSIKCTENRNVKMSIFFAWKLISMFAPSICQAMYNIREAIITRLVARVERFIPAFQCCDFTVENAHQLGIEHAARQLMQLPIAYAKCWCSPPASRKHVQRVLKQYKMNITPVEGRN